MNGDTEHMSRKTLEAGEVVMGYVSGLSDE